MMTPKMKEDFCGQILTASRQLFLSGRISEICREKGTQKQLERIWWERSRSEAVSLFSNLWASGVGAECDPIF